MVEPVADYVCVHDTAVLRAAQAIAGLPWLDHVPKYEPGGDVTEPSRRVQRAARRLADQQSQRLADLPTSRLLIATVTSVTAGASTDLRAVVGVTYRGAELTAAAYNRNQTFTVGDRVLCALVDNQLVITFALGGFPPEL